MANVTGIDINPILQRLNGVEPYHPFDAETFSDWATEAGDMVQIIRDGVVYRSPVHTSRMVWKGKAPTMQISTTGNEKRDAVSRVSRKKYGRGSAGIRSQEGIHRNFVSEDGILHSELHITESYLRTEFHDETNSLRSYFDMTASHMRTEFLDQVHSLRGEFEVTASHLRTEFEDDVNSLRGEFEVTASHLRTEFEDDINSLRGEFEVTASHLRTEFTDDVNSLRGEFEVTASGLRTEFEDDVNSVRSYVAQTASSWDARVEGVIDANGNITAASIALAVNSAGSEARINADRIYLLGQTIADTVDANYIATKIESISSLLAQDITAQNIDASTLKIRPVAGMGAISVATAYNGSSLTRNGNTYTLRLAKMNGEYDEYSFSRATTLSGAWSGRRFTVTASPQGNEIYTDLWSAVPASNITWNGTVATLALNAAINGDETTYSAGTVTADVGSFLQDKTGATKKFTANGLYSADSGYVGFGNIEIDVPQSTVEPTTLSIQWNGSRRLNANANPQGVSRYTTIVSSIPNSDITFSGTTLTLPLKATYDGSETTVAVGSVTANISGKLQTKTITSNGTVNPDAGYIGFGSVTVAVPTTNAGARFNAAEGSYFVEAYDRTSGTSITGSSVTYKLAKSGNKVQIQNASSVQLSSTPEYDMSTDLTNAGYAGRANVTLNDPTWNPVTGATPTYRTVTVTTSGRTNASGTTDNLSKSVALYLTQGSWSSNQLTVSMRAGGTSGTVYASTTVDASTLVSNATTAGYKAGWEAYYNKWWYPVAGTNPGMTVCWPGKTVDSAYDSISRTYTIQNKDDNTVYLRYNNQTYAEFAHNKHTAGYNSAKMSVSSSTKKVTKTSVGSVNEYTLSLVQNTISTTSGTSYGTRKVWIKATPDSGNYVEVDYATISDYRTGWTAAYNQISLPSNNTSSASMTLKTTSSAVGGTAATTTYSLVVDNNVAYIKDGNNVKAQTTHNKYNTGYDDNKTAWLYEVNTGSNGGNLNPGIWVTAGSRDHTGNNIRYCGTKWYTLKAGGVRQISGEPAGVQTLTANAVFEVYYDNGSGGTPSAGIYFKTPSGSASHSISVSKRWTFGGSGYDTGGKLNGGAFSKSGLSVRTYYYITVSCGGTSKQIYFVCND